MRPSQVSASLTHLIKRQRPVFLWGPPGAGKSDVVAEIAKDLGLGAEEGRINVDEWREGNASGEITEVFACGTAAVITPVGSVKSAEHSWTIGDGGPGEVTMRLREALLEIQTGRADDAHGWMRTLVPAP